MVAPEIYRFRPQPGLPTNPDLRTEMSAERLHRAKIAVYDSPAGFTFQTSIFVRASALCSERSRKNDDAESAQLDRELGGNTSGTLRTVESDAR